MSDTDSAPGNTNKPAPKSLNEHSTAIIIAVISAIAGIFTTILTVILPLIINSHPAADPTAPPPTAAIAQQVSGPVPNINRSSDIVVVSTPAASTPTATLAPPTPTSTPLPPTPTATLNPPTPTATLAPPTPTSTPTPGVFGPFGGPLHIDSMIYLQKSSELRAVVQNFDHTRSIVISSGEIKVEAERDHPTPTPTPTLPPDVDTIEPVGGSGAIAVSGIYATQNGRTLNLTTQVAPGGPDQFGLIFKANVPEWLLLTLTYDGNQHVCGALHLQATTINTTVSPDPCSY